MTKYTITTPVGTAEIYAPNVEVAKVAYSARYSYDFDTGDWHWITDDSSDGAVDFRNIQRVPRSVIGY